LAERTEHQGRNCDLQIQEKIITTLSGINPNGYEFYHKVFFYPTYWLEFEITFFPAEFGS